MTDSRTPPARGSLAAGVYTERITARIEALRAAAWPARLLARDTSLWGDAADRRERIGRRLGWVHSASAMREHAASFVGFAAEVRTARFRRVLLLGMGGSSLAPEVLSLVFGAVPDGLPLRVLDDTSPAAVRAALTGSDPSSTLVLVASKSGGTIEVTSFERACFARADAVLRPRAGAAFVAITDPSTALEAHARTRGYRHVFTNAADIGGRYSVLSYFGLLPAALLGIDPATLCDSAERERAEFEAGGGTALEVGAALGELARAGRDKLTLVLSPEWAPLGAWIEQLVAESTGKEGRGILPVDGEPLGEPGAYGNDRVFVSLSVGAPAADVAARLERLAAAGHPVIRWTRDPRTDIGAEFLRWELVTAVAAGVLGVDPFDEPNVSEAKAATQQVLAEARTNAAALAVTPRASSGALTLEAPPYVAVTGDAREWAATFLALIGPGDYAAILAWMHRTPERLARLERLRQAIGRASRAATTLGWGPRYLHSTGQFHKGGPATGVFLQVTADEGDEPIPGESYGFRVLHAAQAAGDLRALTAHGLRVLRVHVTGNPDAGLEELAAAFEHAAGARAR